MQAFLNWLRPKPGEIIANTLRLVVVGGIIGVAAGLVTDVGHLVTR